MVRIVRWTRRVPLLFLVVFIGAQFLRPDRTNPPTRSGVSLITKATPQVAAIIDRACRDCHSNETRWPWYTNVTPTNWLIANHVHDGRDHMNYSKWSSYAEDDQDKFLGGICTLTKRRRMPLPSYLLIHREAKLSEADVTVLCAWSEKMRDMLQ
ncbi:MAG TPA: heme-binding domain-containing protein [Vicinamibacterales bacterium]|nr:heme-binding domain-containing protein [Vicinamibacterales bacterium]